MRSLGITLRPVNEPISDESAGRLTEGILAAVAQFENDAKADRTKAGMRAALERGCRKCSGVSVRKESLESKFVALLDDLQPKTEFLRLFKAIVLDACKDQCAGARRLRIQLENRIRAVRERETVLEQAFLYERRIDSTTYVRQRDSLRQDVALLELELSDARLEEIDVKGLLGFAEHDFWERRVPLARGRSSAEAEDPAGSFPERRRVRERTNWNRPYVLGFLSVRGICGGRI